MNPSVQCSWSALKIGLLYMFFALWNWPGSTFPMCLNMWYNRYVSYLNPNKTKEFEIYDLQLKDTFELVMRSISQTGKTAWRIIESVVPPSDLIPTLHFCNAHILLYIYIKNPYFGNILYIQHSCFHNTYEFTKIYKMCFQCKQSIPWYDN